MKNFIIIICILKYVNAYSQLTRQDYLNNSNLILIQYSDSQKCVTHPFIAGENLQVYKQVVSPKLLSENLESAFSNVVFSSSKLATNSSAFGFTRNEEKTTIATNAKWALNGSSRFFIATGVNATGSGKDFNIYGNESWANNVSGNLGFIFKLPGGAYFTIKTEGVESFDNLKKRRATFVNKPLYDEKYKPKRLTEIDSILFEIEAIKMSISKNSISAKLKELLKKNEMSEIEAKLLKEKVKLEVYFKALKDTEKLEEYIETRAYEFDKLNDITSGYNFYWLAANIEVGNSTYKFEESNVEEAIFTTFKTTYGKDEIFNHINTKVNANFNWTQNKSKQLHFLQINTGISFGSVLESNLFKGDPTISGSNFMILDEAGTNYGPAVELEEKNLRFGTISAYYGGYFGDKKTLGFNISLEHHYALDKKPTGVNFKNNFTLLFGPVFRTVKDDNTSLNFGIDLGWSNALYGTQINDDFLARVRVGIPFNVYKKKEKAEE